MAGCQFSRQKAVRSTRMTPKEAVLTISVTEVDYVQWETYGATDLGALYPVLGLVHGGDQRPVARVDAIHTVPATRVHKVGQEVLHAYK